MYNERTDHDSLFKELIKEFFAEFIEVFFPDIYTLIDFQHIKFLMQEFIGIIKGEPKRITDLLVETKLKGEDGLILVHIENQAQVQTNFEKRMLVYYGRILYEHNKNTLPIAIFSYDEEGHNEPDSIHVQFPFLEVLHFKFFKLELKKIDWKQYVNKENPVVAALLGKMKYDQKEKVLVKTAFVRMFLGLRLKPHQRQLLIKFSQAYLKLDDRENKEFQDKIRREFQSEEVERYMDSVFIWNEESWEKGRQEGLVETTVHLLTKKFSKLPQKYIRKIKVQNSETLREILDNIFELQSLDQLEHYLK